MPSVEAMKTTEGRGGGQRLSCRSILPSIIVAGVILPLVFIRIALLALDPGACPSISCIGWRIAPWIFEGSIDSSKELMEEIKRIYLDEDKLYQNNVEEVPETIDELLTQMSSALLSHDQIDINKFVSKTKAMILKMSQKVEEARYRASIFQYLAAMGVPKSLHCITLRLTEEYLVNSIARSSLPLPEVSSCLTDNSYIHIALITDNVLAASVVVRSTLTSSANPENLVFHVITDKKTYTAMHAWFALHSVDPAILEVKGFHEFNFVPNVRDSIMTTIEEVHWSSSYYQYYSPSDENYRKFSAVDPSTLSMLQHMKIHLPEFFPELKKVIFLDEDVMVQKDLAALWNLDLSGKVLGAVIAHNRNKVDDNLCIGSKFGDHINFSNAIFSSYSSKIELHNDQCTWMDGLNIIDLQSWRRTNITETYQYWLKLNRESEFSLWSTGFLPPALIAFNGKIQSIDSSWQISGLGSQMPDIELLESASVLHFSGFKKPWLDSGFPKLRKMWQSHLKQSNEFINSCRILE